MKKYIRTERANLMEPNVYISMVVHIRGEVSGEDIRRAVMAAYEANEATMSRIVLEANGEAYYEKMEQSGCGIFMEKRDWKAIIRESEKAAFNLKEGELVRTYIIEKAKEKQLLIHAHHLAGDGKSVLILIQDIVNRLAGKPLVYKPMVLIDGTYLTQRAQLFVGVRAALKRANRKWRKTGRVFTWQDYDAIHKKYWEHHHSEIEVKTYSVSEWKRDCIKGVTLNSYLTAKLLQEYPESKVVGIPVSIREENSSMSNQTSGIAVKCQYRQNQSWEENLVYIHRKIYKRLKNAQMKYFVLLFIEQLSPTLLDGVLMQTHGCYEHPLAKRMAHIMGYMGKGGRDIGITNLTRISLQGDYENFQVSDIIFIPPKVSYTKMVMGVSTYKDTLTVTYHCMQAD